MVCKRCGAVITPKMKRCKKCGYPLTYADFTQSEDILPMKNLLLRAAAVLVLAVITVSLAVFVTMRVYYTRQEKKLAKEYVSQTAEVITLDNGMAGHAFTFYGDDGDCIYIEELHESFMFVGGIARVEIPDYIWFAADAESQENANITFSPMLVTATGEKKRLPVFSAKIEVPEAPITINEPKTDRLTVITSQTGLSMDVVYGSQVIINGEDVSSKVDRSGNLDLTLNIQPIGDNNVSILVRTDHHKEARRDLVFYREQMDIEMEVASGLIYTSTQNFMTISGKTEPGAYVEVDTEYDRSSMKIDQETGKFSFKAKFTAYGKNLVSFRAVKEGRKDSSISFYVTYLPAKLEYTRDAWQMDYASLKLYYEAWKGRVFLCIGTITDSYIEDGVRYSIMNVGNEENVKLVALENQSNIGSFDIGSKYGMFADVAGRVYYGSDYIPYLIARYSRD